jgi:hypothetical protein
LEAQLLDQMLRQSLKARLIRLGQQAEAVSGALHGLLPIATGGLSQFVVAIQGLAMPAWRTLSTGAHSTFRPMILQVTLRGFDLSVYTIIEFGAYGTHPCLLRGTAVPSPTAGVDVTKWDEEIRYVADQPPTRDTLLGFLMRSINSAMRTLAELVPRDES